MADFATTVPIARALWPEAEKFLGHKMNWQARIGNHLQEIVIVQKEAALALGQTLNEKQLAAIASNHCDQVNKFLLENDFSLQLEDQGSIQMIYAAAILKLLGKWIYPGTTDYHLPNIGKPGFRLPYNGLKHFDLNDQHIVVVPTDSNFSFLVTRPTKKTGFDMLTDWNMILRLMKPAQGNGLILPMAAIDETKVDVSDLQGMMTFDGFWVIQQALMAAKFGLTSREVKFEAAFAFSARSLGLGGQNMPETGDYVADHDLYFALVRHGHYLPLAVGLIPVDELSDDKHLM